MIDSRSPKLEVEIHIDPEGKRVWVNIDGVCALRIQDIPPDILKIDDERIKDGKG